MFRSLCLALMLALPVTSVVAAEWPTEQVKIISPFPTASTTDLIARLLAEHLEQRLKFSVVVEDIAGASGALGTARVAKAKPDGYTLIIGNQITHAILTSYEDTPSYDAEKDFVPIALLARVPTILVVNNNIPANTVPELIKYIKANPHLATYGSAGTGTSQHVTAEMFKLKTGTNMTHVPFRSANEIMDAVVTGKVQIAFNNSVWAWPLARSGKVRAVGVASLQPSPTVRGVPTIAETIPGFEASSWYGVYAPAGTPRPVVDRLATEISQMLQEPFVLKQLNVLGAEVEIMTPEQFTKFNAAERTKWRDVVKATKAK